MKRTVIAIVLVLVLGGAVFWGMGFGPFLIDQFLRSSHTDIDQRVSHSEANKTDMDEALGLIRQAQKKFADVKDYECTFLRDEYIESDKEFRENHIILKMRHKPFSVYLEWLGPPSKKGRKSAYVHGQNGNRIHLSGVPLIKFIDPDGFLAKSESRHRITEAGLQNLIERFVKSWEKEKEDGLTGVSIRDSEIKIALSGRDFSRQCKCVATVHKPQHREKYSFYRTLLYFDKDTGLPIRMEGYGWPKDADDKEGQLVERYTYLDLKTNVGLTDKDFSW